MYQFIEHGRKLYLDRSPCLPKVGGQLVVHKFLIDLDDRCDSFDGLGS